MAGQVSLWVLFIPRSMSAGLASLEVNVAAMGETAPIFTYCRLVYGSKLGYPNWDWLLA